MPQRTHRRSVSTRCHQSGVTLIEILVTMLIAAIGLLGTAGLQLAATRYQQVSFMRAQAFVHAQFIAEKIRVNSSALTAPGPTLPANAYLEPNTYADAGVDTNWPADPACGLAGQADCTAQQAAQRDVLDWHEALRARLPGGRGAILALPAVGGVVDPAGRQIVVMWTEKQQNTTDDAATDFTDISCPAALAVPAASGVRCLNITVSP